MNGRQKLANCTKMLERKAVLKEFKIDGEQLFVAYCLSKCDDIMTDLKGIGFKTALRILDQAGGETSLSSLKETGIIKSKPEWSKNIGNLYKEIVDLKERHEKAPNQLVRNVDGNLDGGSMLFDFLGETMDDGSLR